MAPTAPKPPAFYCPECGQKHRADLSPLAGKSGVAMHTTCQGCGIRLQVHLVDGAPVCEVADAGPAQATVASATSPVKSKAKAPSKPPTEPPTRASTKPPKKAPKREPAAGTHSPVPAKGARAAAPTRKPPLAEGTHAGRYVIQDLLRRGATSTVYRAEDPETKRTVALKVLGSAASPAEREAFLRQVEVQAKIRHPNILPVYDQGVLEDGRPFFTSELLQKAETFEHLVSRARSGRIPEGSPLAPLAAIEGIVDNVMVPVAEGIYVANVENDVLHGDLRPGNVLIDGALLRPYVTDFGQSAPLKSVGENGRATSPTRREASAWLAPEQAGGEYHVRTDVWGLGALLAFALTGEACIEPNSDMTRAAAAARYRALPDDAPAPLRAIVHKAMAADPERRYVNGRQMAADLRAWRKGGWVRAVDEFGGTEAARIETRQVLQRIGRGLLWVAGGLLLGLLIGSFFEWSGGSGPEPRVTEAAQAVDRLDAELNRLAPIADALAPTEAARVWASLKVQADAAQARLSQATESDARASVGERIAFVRERFTPPPVAVKAGAGVRLTARNVGTGLRLELGAGTHAVPPGLYDVADESGGSLRFPAVVPFTVRASAQRVPTAPPALVWAIPDDARTLDRDSVLVLGGSVSPRRAPYAVPGPAVEVASFRLDRRPLRNDAYLAFLQALPAGERAARLPLTGFEIDEARGTIRVSGVRPEDPIAGVSVEDARAYCAWASTQTGSAVRLPTEAEWILAMAHPRPGEGQGTESDHGVAGLDVPALELVEGPDGPLLKGKTPDERAVYAIVPVAADARVEDVGLRCVRTPKP